MISILPFFKVKNLLIKTNFKKPNILKTLISCGIDFMEVVAR